MRIEKFTDIMDENFINVLFNITKINGECFLIII